MILKTEGMYFRKLFVIGLILMVLGLSAAGLTSCGMREEKPAVTVVLVPLDGISADEIGRLKTDFEEKFAGKRRETFCVKVLDGMRIPDSCRNDNGTRFRADKVIRMLTSEYRGQARELARRETRQSQTYYIVGVTNRDVSISIHGFADYGVLGLSYLRNGRASVISTYRLKDGNDLWKLAAHEFCHGFYHMPHCKADDPHCLMRDAKGGNPHFESKELLCADCDSRCELAE